jgi:hypothetical protein
VKEYVLTKGIFQRVLLFWREWPRAQRRSVEEQRIVLDWEHSEKAEVSKEELVDYFLEVDSRLKARLLKLCDMSVSEWDAFDPETMDGQESREDLTQQVMGTMFGKSDDYDAARIVANDAYFEVLEHMDPMLATTVESFIVGLNNYTKIFSVHLAILDNSWIVTGDHVFMAHEIIYDMYKNLIMWLEEEVAIGAKVAQKRAKEKSWQTVYGRSEKFDFDDKRGAGWVRKAEMLSHYGKEHNLSRNAQWSHFTKNENMFKVTREGAAVYCRLKEEYL